MKAAMRINVYVCVCACVTAYVIVFRVFVLTKIDDRNLSILFSVLYDIALKLQSYVCKPTRPEWVTATVLIYIAPMLSKETHMSLSQLEYLDWTDERKGSRVCPCSQKSNTLDIK